MTSEEEERLEALRGMMPAVIEVDSGESIQIEPMERKTGVFVGFTRGGDYFRMSRRAARLFARKILEVADAAEEIAEITHWPHIQNRQM